MAFLVALFLLCLPLSSVAILYPRESETRQVKSLDGLWSFKTSPTDDQTIGFRDAWFKSKLQDAILMPVPSSYNDITQDPKIRDYLGVVWYQTQFYLPPSPSGETIYLRFGSVNYEAIVFLNGHNVFNHTGGHLPFGGQINRWLNFSNLNLLTVAVNNTLSRDSVPQATVRSFNDTNQYPKGYKQVTLNFDFFNYAGIHRSVVVYTVPSQHIERVTYSTKAIGNSKAIIEYSVTRSATQSQDAVSCSVDMIDPDTDQAKAHSDECEGEITVRNATLWWPYGMSEKAGYLYRGKFHLKRNNETIDVYYEDIGIRTVSVSSTRLLVNGKAVYLTGFGKHEDSAIRGRGYDPAYLVKDFNILKWIGANSFRTSHYPYSEELMQLADREGIMIIDECPAVGLVDFNSRLLEQHKKSVLEMIERDRNHPSVIMWSIANEPSSSDSKCADYFQQVISTVRNVDTTRPVTAAINANKNTDLLAPMLDVLMINRYYAWYSDMGALDVIKLQVVNDFEGWNSKYPRKPILISEYGADTIAGMHSSPSAAFSEDYQIDFFLNYFSAFDRLREQKFFIGEMVWNFADFMTSQTTTRVMGNRKGVFTRDRQPKAAARLLRCRYLALLNVTSLADDTILYCPSRDVKMGYTSRA